MRVPLGHERAVRLPHAPVRRVDPELLPGLRVVQIDAADVWQLALPRIFDPHGDDLMAPAELRERPLPPRGRVEIGDQKDERTALRETPELPQHRAEVRLPAAA